MPPKSHTSDFLCQKMGLQGVLCGRGTKKPSFIKQPDTGIQVAPELVGWLSVAAPRARRTWEGPPHSPFSACPSPANDRFARAHCLGIVLSENSAGMRS